ncbi:CASP-like protein 1D2 [Glycine max]|nr:CASP-like protein 1D2 [Glycine max]|eukprot:XP_014623768.1 CASP-like protein 1D2 [Glycine max]
MIHMQIFCGCIQCFWPLCPRFCSCIYLCHPEARIQTEVPPPLYLLGCMQLILGITTSATGAAGRGAYIGLKGNYRVDWIKVCNVYDKFCRHLAGSIAVALLYCDRPSHHRYALNSRFTLFTKSVNVSVNVHISTWIAFVVAECFFKGVDYV